jgi:hypothetical protein
VNTIKNKIKKDDLYGKDINDKLSSISASGSGALLDAILPLYKKFCLKKNEDKFLESFYGLIPKSCQLLGCDDYKVANLVMIELPEHLIGHHNTTQETDNPTPQSESITKIDPAESGPLSYIAGYVVSKLYSANKRNKGQDNEKLQAILQNMKSQAPTTYVAARSRGGLVSPCEDVVKILEVAEVCFRQEMTKSKLLVRNIPVDIICESALNSPAVKSLWENILFSSDIDTSDSTGKLCLENVLKLYLKVRTFSYAHDFITKYKIKEKQMKSKALRNELKRKDGDNE